MADTPDHIDLDIAFPDMNERLQQVLRDELTQQMAHMLASADQSLDQLVAHFPRMVADMGSEEAAIDILGGVLTHNEPGKAIALALVAIRRLANQQQH